MVSRTFEQGVDRCVIGANWHDNHGECEGEELHYYGASGDDGDG